jgi:hypothetical protein
MMMVMVMVMVMVLQSDAYDETHRALRCFDLFLCVVLVIHVRHRSIPTAQLQCYRVTVMVLQSSSHGVTE